MRSDQGSSGLLLPASSRVYLSLELLVMSQLITSTVAQLKPVLLSGSHGSLGKTFLESGDILFAARTKLRAELAKTLIPGF